MAIPVPITEISQSLTALLKERLGDIRAEETLSFATQQEADDYLERLTLFALAQAERYIDRQITGSGSSSTKTLDGNGLNKMRIPDFTDLTQVEVDISSPPDGAFETILAVGSEVVALPTDFEIAQFRLELVQNAPIVRFPNERGVVRVTATFGWPSLPEPVADALLRLATNAFLQDMQNRRGRLTQVNEFEVEIRGSATFTADIKRDLAPYRFVAL